MKFDHKIVLCSSGDTIKLSNELESEWTFSLLKRFKVDHTVIESYNTSKFASKRKWRDFLFDKYGIRIEKNLENGKVTVKRLNFSSLEDVELGIWSPPDIVRVKNKDESYYELHLNYWQLV